MVAHIIPWRKTSFNEKREKEKDIDRNLTKCYTTFNLILLMKQELYPESAFRRVDSGVLFVGCRLTEIIESAILKKTFGRRDSEVFL